MGMAPGGKAKNFRDAWRKMIAYMKPYVPAIVAASILAIIGTIFTVIGPNQLSEMTNLIFAGIKTGTTDLTAIAGIGMFLLTIYILSSLTMYGQGYMVATVVQKLAKRLRTDISEKINRLPLRYFDRTSYGDVLSRATNDVDTIGQSMNQSIGTLMSSVALLVGATVMMLITDVTLTIAAILSTLAGFVLMIVIMAKSQKYFGRQQASPSAR